MRTDKGSNSPAKALDRHVGGRLARRRRQLGLAASALDQALSLSPGGTAKFENGDRTLSPAHLLALSGVLKVPVGYFFEGAPVFSAISSAAKGDRTGPDLIRETERFLAEFLRVGDIKVRRDLMRLVKAESRRSSAP